MRVIAGQLRSRPLRAPRGSATRPTSDRLRETLFNVLGSRTAGARFADLYAGSGAVGIEALSRGATHCFFAEQSAQALASLHKNLATLDLANSAMVDSRPVERALSAAVKQPRPFDIVFLDPPYEAAAEYTSTLAFVGENAAYLLTEDALVIAEHARRGNLLESYGQLRRSRLLEQGDAALSFYVRSTPEIT